MNGMMKNTMERAAAAGLVSLGLMGLPVGAAGQEVVAVAYETAVAEDLRIAERTRQALKLEAEARTLHDRRDKWGKAAQLYRDASKLREPGDTLAVRDRVWAGRLSFYTGSERQAYQDLLDAAQLALETGHVIAAAHAFLDASWVANRMGWDSEARDLADRARRLSLSPLLASAEKSRVLGRLAPEDEQQAPSSLQP